MITADQLHRLTGVLGEPCELDVGDEAEGVHLRELHAGHGAAGRIEGVGEGTVPLLQQAE